MSEFATFSITDAFGEVQEYQVLFSFDNDENHKSYVVYTDRSFNNQGSLNVFANIYTNVDANLKLYPIETKEEWDAVESVLKLLDSDGQLSNQEKDMVELTTPSIAETPSIHFENETVGKITVLSLFLDSETGKEYVICTDRDMSEKPMKIYVGRVDTKDHIGNPLMIGKITSANEFNRIEPTVRLILDNLTKHMAA